MTRAGDALTLAETVRSPGAVGVQVPAATQLTAQPALAKLSTLTPAALTLTATLTANSAGLAGQNITFTAGTTTICTSSTNTTGTATCNATTSALQLLTANGYTASYAGSPTYLPSSTTAPLIG